MGAVIYVRQSLDRNGEMTAVDRQLKSCRMLASAREVGISEEIVENDTSATKGPRPGFDRLIAGIESGKFSTVIVWHTDRLYRRISDLVRLMEVATASDFSIMSVKSGDIDLSSPMGRMFANMTASVAQYEVEHKGERQVAANMERAKAGVRHFATRPYGYQRVNGAIRIIEPEAAVVREAVNRIIAGESWYAIAKDFAARGIVGINGRPFSYTNLAGRVNNPAIAGIRTYLGDVVNEEGGWPPLVDRATWDRFQTVLENRRRVQGWDKKVKYLGTNIFRCGKCGARIHVTRDAKDKGRQPVYQCENLDVRRNLAKVDELVDAAVIERLSHPDVLSLLTPSEDASDLAAESNDIRARIAGLAELFADGTLTAAAVREQKARLQTRLDALQTRLGAIEGGSVLADLVAAESVETFWHEAMNIRAKRRVVDALFTVTIMPTKRGGLNLFRPEDVVIEPR